MSTAALDYATPPVANSVLLKWMFSFLRPVIGLTVVACSYLTATIAIEILLMNSTRAAINQVQKLYVEGDGARLTGFFAWLRSSEGDVLALKNVLLTLSCLMLGWVILRYLREVSNTRLSMTMVFYIREAVYDKIQNAGFTFHDSVSSGQLINRSLSDLQNVRAFVQTAVITTLDILLYVAGCLILILTRSPWVALLATVPLPVWVWYTMRFSKTVQPITKSVMEAEDKNVSLITENIAGVHVVKAFATEQSEIRRYNENLDTFVGRVLQRVQAFANYQPVTRLISGVSHLSLFAAAGVIIVMTGGAKMNVGDLLMLATAMGAILSRLGAVAGISEQYQNAIVSARRLFEIIDAPPAVPEKIDAPDLPAGNGAVRFEGVTFGYTKDKPVVHDLTFDVAGGQVVALVGPTGAGKSTTVGLLSRFYDPLAGRITLDGIDLRDVSLESLRTQVSFVFQETYLFSETVSANIAYGRPNISQGDIEAAARLAQAHEFIENLPQGYDTVLAERGSSLSGGQKQRLAIARAILTNPRVLILDDATAAVDPATEDLIRRAMRFVMFGRTVFVVAHRISTVKRADLVLVLENGRITPIRHPRRADGTERPLPRNRHGPALRRRVEQAGRRRSFAHATRAGRPTRLASETRGGR